MRIRKLKCSFCRKREDQVAKLVAGPVPLFGRRIMICDECVATANAIMRGDPSPAPAPADSAATSSGFSSA